MSKIHFLQEILNEFFLQNFCYLHQNVIVFIYLHAKKIEMNQSKDWFINNFSFFFTAKILANSDHFWDLKIEILYVGSCYTPGFLQADQLFDFATNEFRCTFCNNIVEEDLSALPKHDSRSMIARFNSQFEPLYILLKEVEKIRLAPEVLEPEPVDISSILG